ncbi:MAG: DUF4286 family protein [Candidatus Dormibacteraceae bacterium]
MSTAVLYIVKSTIGAASEAAFNRWYNEVHVPQFLRHPGAVGARRLRAIAGEDTYQYATLYEFRDERAFHEMQESQLMKDLKADFDRAFPESRRTTAAYEQVWP